MRSYIMELIGTFLLTFAIVFSGEPTVVGLFLMGLVYLGGHISGAHYNPAITTAALVRGKISIQNGLTYMGVQLLGAALALAVYVQVTGATWGTDLMSADWKVGFGMEGLLTAVLTLVVVTVAMGSRYRGTMIHGLAIGFIMVALVGLGGLMNPAIAVAAMGVGQLLGTPALNDVNSLVTFIVGPLVGAVGAAFLYQYLNPDDR